VEHWADGGATSLANTLLLCRGGAPLPDWWGGSVDYGWEIDWLRWRDHRDPASAAG